MKSARRRRNRTAWHLAPVFIAALALFPPGRSKAFAARHSQPSDSDETPAADQKAPPPTTRLKIEISDPRGKPVAQASVYVRFNESGGLFHKDKLAEMDLKTNEDGSVKVPAIPQGKIMIQVIAKGWRTYGRWYDIQKPEDTVQIKLQSPPHWY